VGVKIYGGDVQAQMGDHRLGGVGIGMWIYRHRAGVYSSFRKLAGTEKEAGINA
jgi:hypothetical protein